VALADLPHHVGARVLSTRASPAAYDGALRAPVGPALRPGAPAPTAQAGLLGAIHAEGESRSVRATLYAGVEHLGDAPDSSPCPTDPKRS